MPHPISVPLSDPKTSLLDVAAISFLNPAPLMWDFEHAPRAAELATRYTLHPMKPSACAAALLAGRAGLGLIPIASLTPELRVVPGCTIASLQEVRSIQLIVREGKPLSEVRSIAADTASRSSLAYVQILLRHFHHTAPLEIIPMDADPVPMLDAADAALLIGDPALLALEERSAIEAAAGACSWYDIATLWRHHTGMPWVAAVWAVNPQVLAASGLAVEQLIDDLQRSRDAGMAHTEELVAEWTPRLPLSPAVIRRYLTHNIHYVLDETCVGSIRHMRALAAEIGILPPLPELPML